MASPRDQLQSAQFLSQRVTCALVCGEADPERPPLRRPFHAGVGSVLLAALAVAVVAVFGLVVPGGNNAWRDGRSVIVEKETGTRYVYLDGRLNPVQNYASALLALRNNARTLRVSRASLAGVPRGPRIGIPDAPDSLPDAGQLLPGGWTICSRQAEGPAGAPVAQSVLAVGSILAGESIGDRAVLVQVATGEQFLVRGEQRHRLVDPGVVRAALGTATAAVPVSTALLDALPAGADLAAIKLPGTGSRSSAVPGTAARVGQVLVTQTSDGSLQHFLVEAAQLRHLTPLQYDIQLADPGTVRAYPKAAPSGLQIPLSALARARVAPAAPATPADGPVQRPALAALTGQALCASFADGDARPHLTLGAPLPPEDELVSTSGRTEAGTAMADLVHVPPGRAALVTAMPSADAPAGSLVLICDQGRAYPLADVQVAEMLGYRGARPVVLPGGLVARVPMGSGLDPAAAMLARA